MVVASGQLKGSFKGFKNRKTVFQFWGGKAWRQAEYKYLYHYAYMLRAEVVQVGSRYMLRVEGVNQAVEVRKV